MRKMEGEKTGRMQKWILEKWILDKWILEKFYLSADNLIILIETTKKLTVNIQIPEIFSFEYVFSNV